MKLQELETLLSAQGLCCRLHEPMRLHTTLRVGGEADCFATASNEEQIRWLGRFCRENGVPLAVVGNGSNLLVSDEGVRGVVLRLGPDFGKIEVSGALLKAQSGAPLISLCRRAQEQGLSGLEFASGIPGAVGGAVCMNAGAYGGELADVLETVRALDLRADTVTELARADCALGYRTSRFQSEPDILLLEASFRLVPGDREGILRKMNEFSASRREKQPLGLPNAGSAFKRPADGRAAAAMIDECGLKGLSVGGAQISEKHAGFLVNRGSATAKDVEALLSLVRRRVLDRFGVALETEYRRLGERNEAE